MFGLSSLSMIDFGSSGKTEDTSYSTDMEMVTSALSITNLRNYTIQVPFYAEETTDTIHNVMIDTYPLHDIKTTKQLNDYLCEHQPTQSLSFTCDAIYSYSLASEISYELCGVFPLRDNVRKDLVVFKVGR